MVIEADFYRVRLRFKRLFADPSIFDDQKNAARRYLLRTIGDKTASVYQITSDIAPTDDVGKPSETAGTARYVHKGRVVRSEYFENANVTLEYADFASSTSPSDHQRLWKKERWERMSFNLVEFRHDHLRIVIHLPPEPYEMLHARPHPTT